MAKYRLTDKAKSDLIRIHQWGFRTHGVERADQYFATFFVRFDELAEDPLICPVVDDIREGYRRAVCGRDSIYYRIEGEVVEIMAIIGHQDVEEWL